ncbi:hypothetical protein D3C78_1146580 [compost metagenome]
MFECIGAVILLARNPHANHAKGLGAHAVLGGIAQINAIFDATRQLHLPGHLGVGPGDADQLRPDRNATGGVGAQGFAGGGEGAGQFQPLLGAQHHGVAVELAHGAVEQIGLTDKIRHVAAGRGFIELFRSGGLDDRTVVHHADAVTHRQGFFLVVGDQHEGDADLALQAQQFRLHLLAQLAVQCGQRLVEQQHRRLVHQRTGEGDTLLLAA